MMTRFLVALCCLSLLSACSSKKADDTTAPADRPASTAAAPAAGGAPPQPATAEPTKVEFTDSLVLKYLDYQKQQVAIVSKYVEQEKKNIESTKNSAARVIQHVSLSDALNKEMEAALKAKRAEVGLSEEQFNAVQEAVSMIATGRLLYNQMGGDAQLEKMEAEHKKQLAAMSEAQRAEAEKTFAEMTKGMREIKNGGELRNKFGDQAADVLMKHADVLAKQQEESLKLLGKK